MKKRTAQKSKRPTQKTKAPAKANKATGKREIAATKTKKTTTERKKPSHITKVLIKEQPHALFSQQWMSESTLMARASIPNNSPSGSGAPPPPPPKVLTLSVNPGILCCGVGEVITATATVTGPGASKTTVAISGPGGTKSSPKGSVTMKYKVKKDDCGTVLDFTASADGVSDNQEAKVPVVQLTTRTWAQFPENRDRKKLGVGEDVFITVTPNIGKITWALSGKGELSQDTGDFNMFTASDRAGATTVKVTVKTTKDETIVAKTITCSVLFNIIEPNGISMIRYQNSTDWHLSGVVSAGFCAEAHVHPEDVCFYKIFVREETCLAIGSGYFLPDNGVTRHQAGSPVSVKQGTQDHPSIVNGFDRAYIGRSWFPYKKGEFMWLIPWLYHIDSGSEYRFTIVDQRALSTDTGRLTQMKAFCPPAVKNVYDLNSETGCCAIP